MALVPSTYGSTLDALGRRGRVIAPMWLYVAGEWTEEAVLAALDATVDAIAPGERATLVGHSLGGGLAILYAASRPERVARLVLVDALGASRRGAMARNALSVPTAGRLASLVAARDALSSALTRPRDLGRAGWWGYRRDLTREVEVLAGSDLPRAVVWARDDTLLSAADGAALAERLGADFTLVGDPDRRIDHDWPYRRPELFARTMETVAFGGEPRRRSA